MKRNYRGVTLRMLSREAEVIKRAAKALSTADMEVEPSQLFYTAALEEASELGFTAGAFGPNVRGIRPKQGQWSNLPQRPEDESTSERTTITIHPLHLQVIEAAAEWVGASMPLFLLGSAMAFVAKRRKADPGNKALRALELPEQYEKRKS